MTERKEQSLIFKAWGIRAIRNCQPGVWPAEAIAPSKPIKHVTRRIVKPQPDIENISHACWLDRVPNCGATWAWAFADNGVRRFKTSWGRHKSPKGDVGDTVWTRETWRVAEWDGPNMTMGSDYRADGGDRLSAPCPECETYTRLICQSLDEVPTGGWGWARGASPLKWRPSIHMPRWASRDRLKLMGVRVERVQDIAPEDVIAEGLRKTYAKDGAKPEPGTWVSLWGMFGGTDYSDFCESEDRSVIDGFALTWDAINAPFKPARRNPYTGQPEVCMVSYPWDDTREKCTTKGKVWYTVGNPFSWVYDLMRMKP